MYDQLFIYLIVALNTCCQLMLIWRQKFPAGEKRKYCVYAVAIPVLVMLSMRLLIASGMIHGRVADQTSVEQYITKSASILLIAGPWLVTIAAILTKMRNRVLLKKHAENC
jgi:hypothetical protein